MALAWDKASTPGFVSDGLPKGTPITVGLTQERMLQEAVAELIERDALIGKLAARPGDDIVFEIGDEDEPLG